MATFLEVASIAWHVLMWVCSIAAITVFVLTMEGKLTLPKGPPPGRWKVLFGVLAVLLLAGALRPMV